MKDEHGIDRRYKFGYDRRFQNNMARVKMMETLKKAENGRMALDAVCEYLEVMGQGEAVEMMKALCLDCEK